MFVLESYVGFGGFFKIVEVDVGEFFVVVLVMGSFVFEVEERNGFDFVFV